MAVQRPRAASVFGLLNLVFGGIGFLGALGGGQGGAVGSGAPPVLRELLATEGLRQWLEISQGLALVTSAVTLLLGIALLQMVWWARVGQVWFAVAAMAVGLVSSYVSWTKLQEAAVEVYREGGADVALEGDGRRPPSSPSARAEADTGGGGQQPAEDGAPSAPALATLEEFLLAFRASVALGTLLNLAYYGTIVFFMTRPKIRAAFEAERAAA